MTTRKTNSKLVRTIAARQVRVQGESTITDAVDVLNSITRALCRARDHWLTPCGCMSCANLVHPEGSVVVKNIGDDSYSLVSADCGGEWYRSVTGDRDENEIFPSCRPYMARGRKRRWDDD